MIIVITNVLIFPSNFQAYIDCSVRKDFEILPHIRAVRQESVTFVLYCTVPQLFARQRIYRGWMYNAHANRSEAEACLVACVCKTEHVVYVCKCSYIGVRVRS